MKDERELLVTYFPIFESGTSLSDHLTRAYWYLTPMASRIREVRLLHKPGTSTISPSPDYLGQSIRELAKGRLKVSLVPTEPHELAGHVADADVLLVADELARAELRKYLTKTEIEEKIISRVDHERVQYAGSFYLKLYDQIVGKPDFTPERYTSRMKDIRESLLMDNVYIFGTGPNLSLLNDHKFMDGLCIACNSMVVNRNLMDRLRPKLIVAGDPIFHAGASSYAEKFREELYKCMDSYGSHLIVPMRDHHIYETFVPERHRQKIVAFPFVSASAPNLDLVADHHVTTTSNVLTLFLIPFAATLARKEIRIGGCDGRPPQDNSYFWSHDKKSQINEEMDSIQRAFPAFFKISYDDYYNTHVAQVDTWLTACENKGLRVRNLTPSYIPALATRGEAGVRASTVGVTIVMPCFNAGKHLDVAIQSVRSQDFKDWELLIVDDGSTDDSTATASRHAAEDERVRPMKNASGKGVSGARNTGLDRARGELVCFLDADDGYDEGFLRSRVEFFRTRSNCDVAHGPTRVISDDGRDLDWLYDAPNVLSYRNCHGNPTHCNALTLRKKVADRFRFREGETNGEDWRFVAEILRSGLKSFRVDGPAAWYRVHRRSVVVSGFLDHEEKVSQVLDWVYSTVDGPMVSKEFRHPTMLPPLENVRRSRHASVAIWLILSGLSVPNDKVAALKAVAREAKRNPRPLQRMAHLAAIRTFGTPLSDFELLPPERVREIFEGVRTLGFGDQDPVYVTFDSIFGFGRFVTDVAEAADHSSNWQVQNVDDKSAVPRSKMSPPQLGKIGFILGNGPSLSGFDLKRLKGIESFGMNAAYRHWDRIGWYPTHYACLDEVLGLSHIDPIARLIANADVYGIRKLLLRRDLIQALGPLGRWPNVVDFDALRESDARFAREPLTTGSHTAIWAATLGFSPLVLLGVDADYVEVVAGAERREGNVLEIVREGDNPNYFFDGYQRPGDRYHLPNIGGESHLSSWRVVAAVLAEMGVVAYNLSQRSQVDAFEFCDAEQAVSGGAIEPIPAYRVFRQRRQPLSLPVLEDRTG